MIRRKARDLRASSFEHSESDTFVHEILRNHKGHEVTVVERIRVAGDRLIYRHEVVGPGDKRDEREVVFDLAEQ
jgi:hypothetical protein